jgi:hypothetical protein
VARILRALEISTGLLKEYYLGLNPEMKQLGLLNAPMPPHFQDFTVGGERYILEYTERLAADHPDKTVFVASMKPESQAGESGIVVVKFAHSYCEAAHRLLDKISLAPCLRYCEEVKALGRTSWSWISLWGGILWHHTETGSSPTSCERLSRLCTMRTLFTVIFES